MLIAWLAAAGAAGAQPSTPREELWVTNGHVHDVVEAGGILYLGGAFRRVGPATGHGVPIDGSSGLPVAGFPKVNGTIRAAVPDGSGGWYIGGDFTRVGGVARDRIAQVDAANDVTPWDPGANNTVLALAVSGSTVHAGGSFTTIGGQPRDYLAGLAAATTASRRTGARPARSGPGPGIPPLHPALGCSFIHVSE